MWKRYPENPPQKNGEYIVQFKTDVICFAYYDIKRKSFGVLCGDGTWIEHANIIAWKKKPKPMEH